MNQLTTAVQIVQAIKINLNLNYRDSFQMVVNTTANIDPNDVIQAYVDVAKSYNMDFSDVEDIHRQLVIELRNCTNWGETLRNLSYAFAVAFGYKGVADLVQLAYDTLFGKVAKG